ncbi:MAG TPA: hypothetical protein VGG73_18075 [Vicinamibacterales bacterium]|jgi:hypothetical protein
MNAFASLRRRVTIGVVAVALSLGASVSSARADGRDKLLFTQQDAVQAFDLGTGQGYQIGTATGDINGTTLVEFQFIPTGAPVGDALPIAFQNKVTITDIDGDQIFFDNNGTGTFHLGVPGADFRGSGGPLSGTYVVTGGTGKFKSVKVGSTFTYRAVATNPPAPPDRLGNVFVQVSEQHGKK